MLKRGNRAGKCGDHAELVGDHAGEVIGRLANPDHRLVGQTACGIKAGVVEAGDHDGIEIRRGADDLQQPGKA